MKLTLYGLIVGISVEVVTLIFRFGFRLESTRDTAWLGSLTGGLRIHHSYIGAMLMLGTFIALRKAGTFTSQTFTPLHWLFALGIGLVASDLIHHFLVLWILTGDPQFDLVYP